MNSAHPALLGALALTACPPPLDEPRDVMGNFEVSYVDNLRVYIGDDLVAEAASGEDATVEYNGDSFQISTLCGEEGTDCPSEVYWRTMAVDQPWGSGYSLLNFVNLDMERGIPGQRMGGILDPDGSFGMLSGLSLGANEACAVLGVGTVTGAFNADASAIEGAVIAFEWAAGCVVGDVAIGSTLRLETDCAATRTGEYDVSSVTPEPPIDEEGAEVDPEEPEEEYEVDSGAP